MQIRIIKNDKPQSWYRDRVGEVFNVLESDVVNKHYIVHHGRICNSYVNFDDAEVLNIKERE